MTVTDEVYSDTTRDEALEYLTDWLEEAEAGTAIRIDPGFLRGIIAAFESEPELLATGRIQGVRYTEGQCFIVVGSLDARAPQFGEVVTLYRVGEVQRET